MDDTTRSNVSSVSDYALQYPSEVVTVWDQPPDRRRSAVSVLRSIPLESESNMRRRRRERREPSVKIPDMLIFTLGLAALVSAGYFCRGAYCRPAVEKREDSSADFECSPLVCTLNIGRATE